MRAIAVHSTGDTTNSGNSGARLVAENFELISEWLAWTPFVRNGLNLTINQIDAAECPLIQAAVSVSDDAGQPVLDLTRTNFSLFENGVEQAIDVDQAEVSDQALSVALLLDAGTSLSDQDVTSIQIASRRFVDLLRATRPGGGDLLPTGGIVVSSEHRLDIDGQAFETEGADDFVVPTGKTWLVDGVDVVGAYYGRSGPAAAVSIQIASDRTASPGSVVCAYRGLRTARGLTDGDFEVDLPTPCRTPAGRFWVIVQAEIDFDIAGQWGWAERQPLREQPSAWRNPGGGYGTCGDWRRRQEQCGIGNHPDFAYRLRGRESSGGIGTCQASTTALCLLDRKVKIEVTFRNARGRLSPATARPLAQFPTSGTFSFGGPGMDLLVKVIDGSAINGNLWLSYGGLSNLEFSLKLTDVTTGRVRTYSSPKGAYTSAGDFAALTWF